MSEKIIQEIGRIDSKDDYGFEGTTVVKEIVENEYTGERGRKWSSYFGSCYVEQDPGWWDTTETYDSWNEARNALEEVAKDLYNEYERVTYDR